ncbi:hypothetical protein AK812_SmicGene10805 [Symbiodinium microadriaticum]|uniref:Uncharacterized protein n=1 Tax=Symbiodinium microadriaticum TaxID=2951 RepID=A0A1Q9EET9_SYMMI|nr:hypothetical protein AK812_SmicGene10805 [Symbiodinium microadriaticum]CAE7909697.1 unnamed protein product [Symbiodinium microadriaticum]
MTSDAVPKNKDGTPQWSGDPALFQLYEEECLLWVETQSYHKRHMCVPKLKAELSGPAKRLVLGQSPSWGAHATGVQELMAFLRQRLGKPQLPELSELLLRYFRGRKRRAQETINDYVTRKCEAYVRAQQSMQRVLKDRGETPTEPTYRAHLHTWQGQRPWETGRRASWDSRTSQDTPEEEATEAPTEGETSTAAAPTASDAGVSDRAPESWWNRQQWDQGWNNTTWGYGYNSWGWGSGYYGASSWGWFLLQDSGLDVRERNVVQTALQGNFDLQRVAAELRAQWPETELSRRDKSHRHSSYLGEAVDEGDQEENYEAFQGEELREAGMTEEGLALMTSAEEEAQSALAALHHQRRTLKEARAKQNEVRLSRKYYRSGYPGSTGKTFKPASSSTTTSSSHQRPRDDSDMTCLKCGVKGHRAANCPKKETSYQSEHAEESAPFVCYVNEPDHTEQALSAGVSTGDPQQAYGVDMSTEAAMRSGMAVLDSGATKTIGSVTAIEALMQRNKMKTGRDGIMSLDPDNKPVFSFGNSSVEKCISTAQVRLRAGGNEGRLKVHSLDSGHGPILLSIETLRSLKAVLDFEADLVVFRGLDARKAIPLSRSTTGHQLISLTDDLLDRAHVMKHAVSSLRDLILPSE